MDDVHRTIQRTLSQYQRRLILHLLLLGGAGVACTVVLLWRLMQWGAPLWLQTAVALVGFAALALWQWRVVRRTRLSRSGILLGLDRALGLEARLVTAAQFATAPQPPLLYARLVQDPALSTSELSKRLPRIADRRALLLGLLLFLFLWPWHRAPLAQLAMQIPTATPPMIEPPTTEPGPTAEGGGGRGSPEAAGRGTDSPQPQSQGDQQQPSGGSGSSSPRPSEEGRGSQGGGGEQRDQSSSSQGQGQQPESAQTSQPSSGTQSQDSRRQDASQRDTPSSGQQQQSAASKQQQLSGSSPAQQANAKEQRGTQRAEQLGSQIGAAGAQMASANQEALKADIQQMLQELSTELKQLEAQLQATQHNQPNPAAGTSTDPNLYEQASPLERTSGRALPIQLDVDQQATASTRKGGGVGRPSGQVADATPQQQPEEVALADQTSEETSGQRQAIPPEYRPVFERLSTP